MTSNSRDLQRRSLREVLIQAWQEQGRVGKRESVKQRNVRLYDADDLHIREALLQQLESSIQLMHQD